MKKRSSLFLIMIILVSLGVGIRGIAADTDTLLDSNNLSSMSSITGDVTFPFPKTLKLSGDNYWNMTDLLDVNETLDNIPSFTKSGITAYTGNDLVPQISANRYLVNVTLINATIYDDHDIIGEGEIYFNVTINGNFTETARYGANNDETLDLNLGVFNYWCLTLDINVEVWDDDTYPDPDDALGVYSNNIGTPTSQNISGLTDIGDAKVWLEIEVLDTAAGVTADFLADGCKPYLYFTDETTQTEEADEVFARVLAGNDPVKGKTVLCIQYIYYWGSEYFPTPINIQFHEDDYEEFLIFIDPNDWTNPYRYVFDDGSYVSNTRSQRIAIWENSPTSSILDTEAYVSEELTPLLGDNYTASYKIFNLDEATQENRSGLSGITTMNILVQTSFHNFQEGPPGLLDFVTTELGYGYSIDELNDSIIKEFYQRHYHAFEEGLWFISFLGVDTPKVNPFTFDVMGTFAFPYLTNAYPNVVDDIDRFQKANKNFVNYEYELELTVALLLHARYTITAPDAVNPGDEFDATIEVEILEDETEIALLYDFFLNGTIKALFLNKNFLFDYEGKVGVNIPIGTIGNILSLLGFNPYEQEDVDVDDAGYLTLDQFSLAPTLLGNIMEADLSLHFWEIIKGELPKYYPVTYGPLKILDYFMEGIDLSMEASLDGFVNGTISSSDETIANVTTDSFKFDGTTTSTTTHVAINEAITTNETFEITLGDLAFAFSFLADWIFDIEFNDIIALLAPEYGHMTFDLGTFPDVTWTSDDSYKLATTSVSKEVAVLVGVTLTSGPNIIIVTATIIGSLIVLTFVRRYKK